MATFSSRQWLAISGSIILFASLFFINRKAPAVANQPQPPSGGHVAKTEDFSHVLDEAKAQVAADKLAAAGKLEKTLSSASAEEQGHILNSIINIYDSAGARIPATYYMEKLAALQNSARLWYNAGNNYYNASELADQAARGTLIQKASECYNNSLKIDSANLDTKVGIAKCLVEGGGSPMQGIQMLEGVLRKDSNNENAQLALGEFSIQSGQYPKAIYRFKRVLQIDPNFIEANLYLEDTYEKMGNKQEAISCLKKYSTFVHDKKIKAQVESYMKKLESNDTITNK